MTEQSADEFLKQYSDLYSERKQWRHRFEKDGERVIFQMARKKPELLQPVYPAWVQEAVKNWEPSKLDKLKHIVWRGRQPAPPQRIRRRRRARFWAT